MKAILIGGFIETIELLERLNIEICGIADSNEEKIYFKHREKYTYIGNDDALLNTSLESLKTKNLILSPDVPKIRRVLYDKYRSHGFTIINVVSDKAIISPSANIINDTGVKILDGVNISSNVSIKECVKINVNANIMHDCKIGAFSTIAPNAVLLGGVTLGENTYIGANSTILPLIMIGKNAVVGAGAVVTKDVMENSVVAGVPARVLTK